MKGRNKDYQELVSQFAQRVVKLATIIKLFPDFMKPSVPRDFSDKHAIQYMLTGSHLRLVGDYICNATSSIKRGMHYLTPIIDEHLKGTEDFEDDLSGPVS